LADEITGCSAGSLAISTIKRGLDAKTLSVLPNPLSESNSYPKVLSVPMQVVPYQSRVTTGVMFDIRYAAYYRNVSIFFYFYG